MDFRYWKHAEIIALCRAERYEDLAPLALAVLRRMPQPIGQVCGPISTGGFISAKKNLLALAAVVERLTREGRTIFNQLPFEGPMFRIRETPHHRYATHLLEAFYIPIFESGLVRTLYFMPNWETSHGARWEHEQAIRLGIPIAHLGPEYLLDVPQ